MEFSYCCLFASPSAGYISRTVAAASSFEKKEVEVGCPPLSSVLSLFAIQLRAKLPAKQRDNHPSYGPPQYVSIITAPSISGLLSGYVMFCQRGRIVYCSRHRLRNVLNILFSHSSDVI